MIWLDWSLRVGFPSRTRVPGSTFSGSNLTRPDFLAGRILILDLRFGLDYKLYLENLI